MRKSLVISLLVLMGAAGAWNAQAQDCRYHNIKLDTSSFAFIEPIAPYDACWEFAKVTGTLGDRWVSCVLNEQAPRTSNEIWGDGWVQLEANKFLSFLETRDGVVEIREWSWLDYDVFGEAGLAKIIGGTGAFENAFGTLFYMPFVPFGTKFFPVEGYICMP